MNTPEPPTFDHVAIAVPSIDDVRALVEESLSAESVGGGDAPGFSSWQWRFANGLKLELLEPFRQTEDDFLQRFIATHGPRAHHLTFRVPDVHTAAEAASDAGFPILYLRDSNADWKEAFIHPRDAEGTLIQLAEFRDDGRPAAPGSGYSLQHVEVAVTDVDRARRLFEDVLGGTISTTEGVADAVTVSWPGTGAVRLVGVVQDSPAGILRLVFGPWDLHPDTDPSRDERETALHAGLGVEVQIIG